MNKLVYHYAMIALVVAIFAAPMVHAQHYSLLVGTYTNAGKSEGMYIYDFNSQTGECTYLAKSPPVSNPSFLTLSRDEKYVYAVSEDGVKNGSINAFRFDEGRHTLQFINKVTTGGSPCYVAVDGANTHAFAANYGGGSVFAVGIRADGSLDSTGQLIRHNESNANSGKSKEAHAHSTVLSPDEGYLLSADLGLDKLFVYRFNRGAVPPLTASSPPFVSMAEGSGPRHITFHPNSKFVYVVNEISGSVTAYRFNKGQLDFIDTITMLKKGFHGTVEGADIHISPDGEYLYATNREESNELLIYKIMSDGKLVFRGRNPTLGKGPRNFAIDPTGNFILVANQNTDEVIVFNRDRHTGLVKFTGKKINLSKPVCLKFTSSPRSE